MSLRYGLSVPSITTKEPYVFLFSSPAPARGAGMPGASLILSTEEARLMLNVVFS